MKQTTATVRNNNAPVMHGPDELAPVVLLCMSREDCTSLATFEASYQRTNDISGCLRPNVLLKQGVTPPPLCLSALPVIFLSVITSAVYSCDYPADCQGASQPEPQAKPPYTVYNDMVTDWTYDDHNERSSALLSAVPAACQKTTRKAEETPASPQKLPESPASARSAPALEQSGIIQTLSAAKALYTATNAPDRSLTLVFQSCRAVTTRMLWPRDVLNRNTDDLILGQLVSATA
ncbi:hypothetical protein Tco_0180818 [Tanacetum coccineum]